MLHLSVLASHAESLKTQRSPSSLTMPPRRMMSTGWKQHLASSKGKSCQERAHDGSKPAQEGKVKWAWQPKSGQGLQHGDRDTLCTCSFKLSTSVCHHPYFLGTAKPVTRSLRARSTMLHFARRRERMQQGNCGCYSATPWRNLRRNWAEPECPCMVTQVSSNPKQTSSACFTRSTCTVILLSTSLKNIKTDQLLKTQLLYY